MSYFLKFICVLLFGEKISSITFENNVCLRANKEVANAKNYVSNVENFSMYLKRIGYFVSEDQPAFQFFSSDPIGTAYDYYKKSEQSVALSEYIKYLIFPKREPRMSDINGLLERYTDCVKPFYEDFCVKPENIRCDKNLLFQPINGYCNNLENPKDGAAGTHYASIAFQTYDDSIQTNRRVLRTGEKLPIARNLVSTFLDRCQNQTVTLEMGPNVGASMFGQILAHDCSFKPFPQDKAGGPGIRCCTGNGSDILPDAVLHPECDALRIPENDSFFSKYNVKCVNFVRTQAIASNVCKLSSRRQLNNVTSSLDLSVIYSVSKTVLSKVRTFEGGKMKLDERGILGKDLNGEYILADPRILQTPVLTIFHSLMLREHNRIASIIQALKPDWNDEKIFRESRRFVIAEYQSMIYNEWLPVFTGGANYRIRYPPTKHADLTTTNEFAHSAFRYWHLIIPETFRFYDAYGTITTEVSLSDSIGQVEYLEKQFEDVARGLFFQETNFNGCHDQIINKLFKDKRGVGIDLLSTDIQRTRDHGVAPYFVYVNLCHGIKIKTFSDLSTLIKYENIQLLEAIFDSVYDIDLHIGSLLEDKQENILGPTITCLVNEQFHRFKTGDRWFYDNPKNPYPFTRRQLYEINKASFARILCDNTGLTHVPRYAFMGLTRNSNRNSLVNCSMIPRVHIVL